MDREGVKILLVEDDPDDVWLMRGLLGDCWDGSYELVHVDLLATALELCRRQAFDVMLLDLGLPDSQGMETFLAVCAQVEEMPIIILSGHKDQSLAIRAVQAGAEDYLVKGDLNDSILVRSIRYAIERRRRRQAEEELRGTVEEFRAAHEIQQMLYPSSSPKLEKFDIAGALMPAKAAAGDCFDYIPCDDGSLAVVVGDVSGHGMGPALVMAETRACLRTLCQSFTDVGEILTRANRLLTEDAGEFHFVTLAMLRIDPTARTLVYASAGQRGYLLDAANHVTVLDSTSMPLGVQQGLVVPASAPKRLVSNDMILFFTDGVVEAESPGKVRFGIHRALDVVRSERERPAIEMIAALKREIAGFTLHQPQRDDMTMVVIKVE